MADKRDNSCPYSPGIVCPVREDDQDMIKALHTRLRHFEIAGKVRYLEVAPVEWERLLLKAERVDDLRAQVRILEGQLADTRRRETFARSVAEDRVGRPLKYKLRYTEEMVLEMVRDMGPLSPRAIEKNPPPTIDSDEARMAIQGLIDKGRIRVGDGLKLVVSEPGEPK
jgi:hypothetical protein